MCVFSVRLLPDLIHSAQPASRPRLYRPPQIPQCPQHEPFGVGEREKEHRVSARDCRKARKDGPPISGLKDGDGSMCVCVPCRARGHEAAEEQCTVGWPSGPPRTDGRGTVVALVGRPAKESHTSGDTVCPRPQTSLRLPRYGPPAASGAYRVCARILPCADVVVLRTAPLFRSEHAAGDRAAVAEEEGEGEAGGMCGTCHHCTAVPATQYCTYAYNTIIDRTGNALCSWVLQ